jgi:tetratricopeptide (TPR) repeat protein
VTSPMDQELRQLFEEIASDPTSTLGRIPTGKIEEWAGDPKGLLSPRGDYLSKAEKHLMTAYREEAAKVLVQASVDATKKKSLLIYTPEYIPRREALEHSAARLAKTPELGDFVTILQAVGTARASRLAAASLALVPRDSTRICLAVALRHEGHEQTGLGILNRILASRPSHLDASMALENKGAVLASRHQFAEALECDRAALLLRPGSLQIATWRVTMAFQLGDDRLVAQAAAGLRDTDVTSESIGQISRQLFESRRQGVWKPTRDSLELMRRTSHAFDDNLRSIGHAFATVA